MKKHSVPKGPPSPLISPHPERFWPLSCVRLCPTQVHLSLCRPLEHSAGPLQRGHLGLGPPLPGCAGLPETLPRAGSRTAGVRACPRDGHGPTSATSFGQSRPRACPDPRCEGSSPTALTGGLEGIYGRFLSRHSDKKRE